MTNLGRHLCIQSLDEVGGSSAVAIEVVRNDSFLNTRYTEMFHPQSRPGSRYISFGHFANCGNEKNSYDFTTQNQISTGDRSRGTRASMQIQTKMFIASVHLF